MVHRWSSDSDSVPLSVSPVNVGAQQHLKMTKQQNNKVEKRIVYGTQFTAQKPETRQVIRAVNEKFNE